MKLAFDHSLLEESADDLYENAPCGYVSTLPDGTIIKVNRTFLVLTGYESAEILYGRRFQDLLTIGGKIYHETHFAPLLQMQGKVSEVLFDIVTRGGPRVPVLTSVVQKRDAAGAPLVNRITIFDITERKKYERELLAERKRAENYAKAKTDFLSMMSHEIRTPMNAVVGVAHLLETTELDEDQRQYLDLLRNSADNLMNLLNSILDYSKLESGYATVEARNFDLKKVIRDCSTALQGHAQGKNIALKLAFDPDVKDYYIGDPVKIGQIVSNLVGNAIKFTDTGSVTIHCDLRSTNETVSTLSIAVTDTGIGIAPEKLAAIFDEFSQADYEIGVRFGGSGLGLAISKKLVELFGSRIEVASEMGKGSTFKFQLALPVGAKPSKEVPTHGRPNSAQLNGLRVLLADDNDDNAFLLERFFTSWGVEFVRARDGREAVEKVRSEYFDVVLMDLRMPLMDGYAATNAIRVLPGKSKEDLPILAFSASMKVGEEDLVEITPFNDTIGKPFRPEELFSKLAFHGRRG